MTSEENSASFSEIEIDTIGEILNISMGSAATALSTLLDKRVAITIPSVSIMKAGVIKLDELEPAIGVEITYTEGISGTNVMVLKIMDVKSIVNIMTGGMIELSAEDELDELSISALCEVMNQMMGSSATALADFLNRPVNISTPQAVEIDTQTPFKQLDPEDNMIVVAFHIDIEDVMHSKFISVLTEALARELVDTLMGGMEDEPPIAETPIAPTAQPAQMSPAAAQPITPPQQAQMEVTSRPIQPPTAPVASAVIHQPSEARPVQIPNFDMEKGFLFGDERQENLDLIRSVPLEVTVEIGKATRKVKEILEFSQGTVIELDKQAGAQVDVLVNGKLIAKGDVVVIGDNFGVRISDIVKREELINI